jgi:uncharacterized cupin superfamily protein
MTLSRQSTFDPAASTSAFRHHDAHLALEGEVREGRRPLAAGAGGAQRGAVIFLEGRQAGDVDHVAVPDAEVEGPARLRHGRRADHLLVHPIPPLPLAPDPADATARAEEEEPPMPAQDAPRRPVTLRAAEAPARARATGYPPEMARKVAGREKRPLGDLFGLRNFGVNLTRLAPGAASALRHAHSTQDEFVYVLEGEPTLITDAGETPLAPGICAGFAAGTGDAHHLVNRTGRDVLYLEVGDRTPGDRTTYPDDDLQAEMGADGAWRYSRKDGTPI